MDPFDNILLEVVVGGLWVWATFSALIYREWKKLGFLLSGPSLIFGSAYLVSMIPDGAPWWISVPGLIFFLVCLVFGVILIMGSAFSYMD